MLNSTIETTNSHSSNLLFMRRRQAADLLLSLAEGPNRSTPAKNLLLDALYQLPTECFIADDWHVILEQVTQTLLLQQGNGSKKIPNELSLVLASIQQRLSHLPH